jgi:hypothetical protein
MSFVAIVNTGTVNKLNTIVDFFSLQNHLCTLLLVEHAWIQELYQAKNHQIIDNFFFVSLECMYMYIYKAALILFDEMCTK